MSCSYLIGSPDGPKMQVCASWTKGFCEVSKCGDYCHCMSCLADPYCGWCTAPSDDPNAEIPGKCMEGGSSGPGDAEGECTHITLLRLSAGQSGMMGNRHNPVSSVFGPITPVTNFSQSRGAVKTATLADSLVYLPFVCPGLSSGSSIALVAASPRNISPARGGGGTSAHRRRDAKPKLRG